jgi:hypothetical protein
MSDAEILAKLARWAQQNPEANAGDHAGQELLDLVRSISTRWAQAGVPNGVRCQTCHRIIPKEVSLQDLGDREPRTAAGSLD